MIAIIFFSGRVGLINIRNPAWIMGLPEPIP
jgi:hypothetical protein